MIKTTNIGFLFLSTGCSEKPKGGKQVKKCWFLSILLAPALFCLLLATPAQTASSIWRGGADQPPGVGTSQSPYRISTGEHLKWFANEVNSGSGSGHARLTDDIMLNGISNWEN